MADKLVEVKIKDRELRSLARKMGITRKQIPTVLSRALKATAKNVRTIIKQQILRKEPSLPSGQIHRRTRIRAKASIRKLFSIVGIASTLIPLKKIKGVRGKGRFRGGKSRPSYIVWKGKSYPRAFRATMPSGMQGIFMRKFSSGQKPILSFTGDLITTGEPNKNPRGLPIQEIGINLKEVFHKASGVKQQIDKESTAKLRVNIISQIKRLIK